MALPTSGSEDTDTVNFRDWRFAIVPSPGAQHPADWRDKHNRQWFRLLPPETAPGLGVCVFEHGLQDQDNFSWRNVHDGGNEFLACLLQLISNENTLRRAYEQQFNFRHFLQALAGVVLFGTPHSTSENIDSWQSPALLVQTGIISRKKKFLDTDDVERFAKFSLQFEQASVIAPILSVYETQPSKVKGPLWSVKKVLPVQLTGKNFVATHSRHEELLALDTDHKNLCNVDTTSVGFTTINRFLTTVLEDTRLRIVRGSPICR
ncbi:MAG: hypothetical protein Q9225_007521 [Loekoesia sp. 1 TL-2023]